MKAATKPLNQSTTLPSEHVGLPQNAFQRLQQAVISIKSGNGVLIVDDEDRENEGDLIFAAHTLTEKQMALLIRECSGIVCLCLPAQKADQLSLPPMVNPNNSRNQTAFTVTIEAAKNVTTGVSARDRVTTIQTAISPHAVPADLCRPGHVFPLCAVDGGVLERRGHTEASIDLMRLSGVPPYAVLCELTNSDGTMAKLPDIIHFADIHQIPLLSVSDLATHCLAHGTTALQISAPGVISNVGK
ncbi:MAG: 3,4-dihydroxy-2-butanone-4-phosphate synthase [Deltaproteobacteria bacterium]|nr:3,4-dihydroxy-2-butanone-4-phosphate synthase [Deltaproteobacteria bacterium]